MGEIKPQTNSDNILQQDTKEAKFRKKQYPAKKVSGH